MFRRNALLEKFALKRDYYAGGLMLLIGVGAAVTGTGYKFGTLARMGPGFMPVVLGVVLAFLGLLIAGTALGSSEPDDKKFLAEKAATYKSSAVLAAGVTVFGVLLFHYLLNIPFPLLRGVNL